MGLVKIIVGSFVREDRELDGVTSHPHPVRFAARNARHAISSRIVLLFSNIHRRRRRRSGVCGAASLGLFSRSTVRN